MSIRKKHRFNFWVLIGFSLLFVLYKLVKWILTFKTVHWILIGLTLILLLLIRRHLKQLQFQREAEARKLMIKRQGNLIELRKMDPLKFEKFVCDLFIQLGYEAYVTKGSG